MAEDEVPRIAYVVRPDLPELAKFDVPEERYRYLVGTAVSEMANVDYLVACVIDQFHDEHEPELHWGQTGEQLADQLLAVLPRAGSESGAVGLIHTMYRNVYEDRNDLVHAMYDGPGGVGERVLHTLKIERATKKAPGLRTKARRWDEWEVCSLIQEARGLTTDALIVLERLQDGRGHDR